MELTYDQNGHDFEIFLLMSTGANPFVGTSSCLQDKRAEQLLEDGSSLMPKEHINPCRCRGTDKQRCSWWEEDNDGVGATGSWISLDSDGREIHRLPKELSQIMK